MVADVVSGVGQVGSLVTVIGAALLGWGGLASLRSAGGTSRHRLRGLAELGAALAVLTLPGAVAAGLLTLLFLAFCAVHLRDWRTGGSCDCFGAQESVDPRRAAAWCAGMAGLGIGALAVGAPSLRELLGSDSAGALAWLPGAAVLGAALWRFGFSGTVALERLVDGSGARLAAAPARTDATGDGGIERRDFLLRVAVVGSALAIAPLRYLLYPGSALAAVVRPWECAGGLCTDGYTAFCCEITAGGVNTCPADTFPGGWWMCTDYRGRQLCSGEGVRYYVDCNAFPGRPFPGGCQCANGNCDERKVNCNIFRYGQCNTQIAGTTAVVCRMIVCENPATISELNCSAALATDESTCGHDAPCLQPPALELAGAGGA